MTAKAAFYDVDGTLVRTNIVHTYAYYAMNRGTLSGIAGRTLAAAAQVPLYAALDLVNRKWFNEYFYRAYAGLSEDRLVVLGEEMLEDVLKPALFPKAQDLIVEARRAGCRIVFITGALDFTVQPLARLLGADDLIANKMQFVGGIATGKVSRRSSRARTRRTPSATTASATTWRSTRASPTRTASPTTPCWRWWGVPPR
jgi:HAD superfamily phosphoserine phosphatase-like hydrolase